MCGLFGVHKNHNISTTTELKKLNDEMVREGQEFLKQVIDLAQLKSSHSYGEYLESKAKAKVKTCKNMAMKIYEVGLQGDKRPY